MKKSMEVMILICLFLVNIIISGILIFTVSGITAPDITAEVDVKSINKDNISLSIALSFDNANYFSFIAEEFIINITTSSGGTIGEIKLTGGEIPAYTYKTFTAESVFSLQSDDFNEINTNIYGIVGANVLGVFSKTLPLEINVITSLSDLFSSINPPDIHLSAEIIEIDDQGVQYSGSIEIDNPNSFEIIVRNISTDITADDGSIIGHFNVPSTTITQQNLSIIPINGHITYTAINAEYLTIAIAAEVEAFIAGLSKTIPLSTSALLHIPNINEILLTNETLDFSISSEFKIRLQGILSTVGLKIKNPTKIPFEARNLICEILAVTGNDSSLIAKGNMNECEIYSGQEVCIKTTVTMPYMKLLTAGGINIIPDWFVIRIKGEFAITNTTQGIPISLSGYFDPRIFN